MSVRHNWSPGKLHQYISPKSWIRRDGTILPIKLKGNMAKSGKEFNLNSSISLCGGRLSVKTFTLGCFIAVAFVYMLNIFSAGGTDQIMHVVMQHGDGITVLINTYERHDKMETSVAYYSKCPLVQQIGIVWSERGEPPEALARKYAKSRSPVINFERHPTGSLNNRFKPLQNAHSDAIFSVDDDMQVPCDELALAYQVWKGSQRSMVGYMPRMHIRGSDGQYIYRCWWRVWWHGSYSIILTKASFLHHDFLDAYTNHMPQSIRDLVDKNRNCEDIAMQFLMANMTKLPPIYVKGHLGDSGVLGGISTNSNVVTASHMDARSQCLNDLVHIYGYNPLVSSNFVVDSASNGWTNAPSTWWEFISSDLWNWF